MREIKDKKEDNRKPEQTQLLRAFAVKVLLLYCNRNVDNGYRNQRRQAGRPSATSKGKQQP